MFMVPLGGNWALRTSGGTLVGDWFRCPSGQRARSFPEGHGVSHFHHETKVVFQRRLTHSSAEVRRDCLGLSNLLGRFDPIAGILARRLVDEYAKPQFPRDLLAC